MFSSRKNTFYTLAQVKSFTKTAEKLNITQPAVSQHIKYLEEMYGVSLIKKEGRKTSLTEEGKILYEHIQKMLAMERQVTNILKNQSNIIKRYKLGATKTIGAYLIPDILGKYKMDFPNQEVILEVGNTENILNKLKDGELDLALVEGLFNKEKYDYTLLKKDELVPVFSSFHPFAKREEIKLGEVFNENLILREVGSGTRTITENYLKSKGYSKDIYKIFMEIGDITAIKSLVKWNLGYSIISREAIQKEVEEKSLFIVNIEELMIEREFNFVWRKGEKCTFIEEFIKFSIEGL
ncbi:LysR family transcriptional regulator [Crassaminicella profunda]|uniref:LysR family transcriptional regulator n=1 Tax=Crassaminicella profunda TaxID=1286698 RepID=UPI001CA7AD2D|nr:LysR family transcriptional regulator [Crassaminicella profunda]QZY55382.1 LysR family transcriptional regulator [Crassaminicella profunda]